MTKYNIYNKGNNNLFDDIVRSFDVDEVVARIIVNRDIPYNDIGEFIKPDINKLYNPYLLTDIEEGARLVKKAVEDNKKIRIIGDYDIDGVMSTYVLLKGLMELNANVDYQIPHRIEDGYGLNVNIIETAIKDKVDLIITCDNGVSAMEEIKLARESGVDVVITDHHELSHTEDNKEIMPCANALINPKRYNDKYPNKNLCGATVAWKFITVLFDICEVISTIPKDSEYIAISDKPQIMDFLQYVAFATIGDVMKLVGENRTIVKYGLDALSFTKNLGLKALLDDTLKDSTKISPYHVGFVLGPCINASGRLDTASKSLELLLAEDEGKANQIAYELVELNEERKSKTTEGTDKAFAIIEENYLDDKILVVYVPGIHESIAGIVAGRVREKYSRPAIILCDGEGCVKGSGRSIENYNLYEGLHECKDLFIKFGGHPMAAGMSLELGNVDTLRERLNNGCALTEEELVDVETIDLTINLEYLSIELIEQLELLEPFGNGNKKPIFAHKNTPIHSIRRISDDKYFKIEFATQNGVMQGLYFKDADELEKRLINKFGIDEYNKALAGKGNGIDVTIVFYPQINEYKGYKNVQIVLSDVIV